MNPIEQFEKLLANGQDNALLRYSLGNAYLKEGDLSAAIEHLGQAVKHDTGYTAAWKAYAGALADSGNLEQAIDAYEQGIAAANNNGDIQAGKEMRVFLKRLHKQWDQK
ncbi:Tfp pilus assembly protein PilF [Methylohalomonas lacus]|uniref:Tfp pilus assembly protein PilF n=1 Tax=Methylohalomonas lacus TaxID=398773 RepID=A0AAE3HNG4_9GAMM|nr:tetratricopeptide repeat protein [Methylohalomonas lacus]MCS3904492.1 Tfp pilus assembly protein PilF [Methylohalomonas lacus]